MNLAGYLLEWYDKNGRDLPWRKEVSPYKIWLSEIIMQQTRVAQGLPYFLKFFKELPTVADFAKADQNQILHLWQGLGYYSRGRNMHFAANQVMTEFEGEFPSTFKDLKRLKGVGDYTAAAIASIAFNEVKAVVDGNVYRVLSRVFDIDLPIDSTEGKKHFQELADSLIDQNRPGDYNQAIMDFGAMVCVPKSPLCENCTLAEVCLAKDKGTINARPVKTKKVKVTNRYLEYFEIQFKNEVLIQQRQENDIWKGLYQFPMIEVAKQEDKGVKNISLLFDNGVKSIEEMGEKKHILSHQRLYASFYRVIVSDKVTIDDSYIWVNKDDLKNYAFPKLISNYIND